MIYIGLSFGAQWVNLLQVVKRPINDTLYFINKNGVFGTGTMGRGFESHQPPLLVINFYYVPHVELEYSPPRYP